jgi:aromatic ring-opening dioxygenase catalytic subunit (LigB family)
MEDPAGQWRGLHDYLTAMPETLPAEPEAVVVVTAHWVAPEFTVASGEAPDLIYDYGGFPPHTYELKYPAPGSPAVASRISELAAAAGLTARLDPQRGWDHGVFVPVAVCWPGADVPIVSVSLRRGLDPSEHIRFGEALESLRDEGVLLIGSGLSSHDLSFRITAEQATAFDDWLEATMKLPRPERAGALSQWESAPQARAAHPHEDHLLPLMVVTGAGGADDVTRTYRDEMFGLPVAGYRFG